MTRLGVLAALLALACSTGPGPTPTVGPTLPPSPTATAAASQSQPPTPQASPTLPPLVDAPLPAEVAVDLQGVLDSYVVEHHLAPSISAAVLLPGTGSWYGTSGYADSGNEVAATPDTVYAIGSITRTYIAALILRLAEDSFLDLDDLAADHLGPVASAKTNGATIRQLLGNRSGIDTFAEDIQIFDDHPWSVAEVLELVGDPNFAPGERYEYSPTDYLLLGLIAEVVTGGPLGELLHEHLLDRFDLSRTFYGASEAAPEPVAHGYLSVSGQLSDTYDGSGKLPDANTVSAARGAGSMASTAPDLARWIHLLYGREVLRPESMSAMLDFSASIDNGLGTMRFVVSGAGEVIGQSGNIPGFRSAAYMARETGTIVVILTNGETLDMSGALARLFSSVAP